MKSVRNTTPIRAEARAEQVDVLAGGRGDPLDRAVRWRDLKGGTAIGFILSSLGTAPGFTKIVEVATGGGDIFKDQSDLIAQAIAAAEANQAAAENLLSDANVLFSDTEAARDAAATSAANALTNADRATQAEEDADGHRALAAARAQAATDAANDAEGFQTSALSSATNAASSATTASGAASTAVSASETAVQVARQGRGVIADNYFGGALSPSYFGVSPTFLSPGVYPTGRTLVWTLGNTDVASFAAVSNTAFWIGPRYAPAYRAEVEIAAVAGEVVDGAGWRMTITPAVGPSRGVDQEIEAGPASLAVGERGSYSSILVDPAPGLALPSDVVSIAFHAKLAVFGATTTRTVRVHRIDIKEASVTEASTRTLETSLANLEGYAAATYSFRAKAGGATGEIEIVATDDAVNGPASIVRISADSILLDGTIRQAKILDAQIGTAKIIDGAITNAKIQSAAINSAKIQNLEVDRIKLRDGSISACYYTDQSNAGRGGIQDFGFPISPNQPMWVLIDIYMYVPGPQSGDNITNTGGWPPGYTEQTILQVGVYINELKIGTHRCFRAINAYNNGNNNVYNYNIAYNNIDKMYLTNTNNTQGTIRTRLEVDNGEIGNNRRFTYFSSAAYK